MRKGIAVKNILGTILKVIVYELSLRDYTSFKSITKWA
jgi:hypothetical protein